MEKSKDNSRPILKVKEIASEELVSRGNIGLFKSTYIISKNENNDELIDIDTASKATGISKKVILNLFNTNKIDGKIKEDKLLVDKFSFFKYFLNTSKGISLSKEEIEKGKKFHESREKKLALKRDSVFISYSHKDAEWLHKLRVHISPKLEERINFWDDSKILPGDKWRIEIEKALARTKIGIIFISAHFFKSKFILEKELPSLLQAAEKEGATILTIYIRPCYYEEYPAITQYQWINSPENPVIGMSDFEMDKIWVKTVKRIANCLKNENSD